MTEATHILKIVIQVVDAATAGLEKIDHHIEKMHRSSKAYLGIGFSLLFQGMALQRTTEKFLMGAWNAYSKVIDVQDIYFQKVQELRAGWEFFKFSLIDALLQSDLFAGFLNFLWGIVDALNSMTPAQKAGLAKLVGYLIIGAGVASIFGAGLLTLGGIAWATGVPISVLAGDIALVAIWALVAVAAFTFLNVKTLTPLEKILIAVGVALGVVGIKLLGISLITGIWVIAIAGIFIVLGLLMAKFGGFTNAMKAWGIAILLVLGMIGDAIVTMILTPFQWIVLGIIKSLEWLGHSIPDWMTGFVEFKPNIVGKVAEITSGWMPEVQKESPIKDTLKDMGDQIKDAMKGVLSEMGSDMADKVGESVENAITQNAELIPSPQR